MPVVCVQLIEHLLNLVIVLTSGTVWYSIAHNTIESRGGTRISIRQKSFIVVQLF